MIRTALASVALLVLLGGAPVAAQAVRVQAGEHEGFSRLVLTLPRGAGWQMSRTDDGYALALDRGAGFDLSEVFRLIPRTRLAAIWADPATGRLRLGLGCRCHATAFEFRPGILVVDIRDGPPPQGSAFERDAEGRTAAAPPPRGTVRPRARPAALTRAGVTYDWRGTLTDPAAGGEPAVPGPRLPALPADPAALVGLREAMLAEFGRGAARGLVEMTLPQADPAGRPRDIAAPAQLRIGGPGQTVPGLTTDRGVLTGDGRACLSDAALDLAAWGDDRPAAMALGPRRDGIVGEFDRPDPEAAVAAARYLLHLGFGAEARQTIEAAAPGHADAPVLRALSRLVDGESPVAGVFDGMDACETGAALWAVLARPGPPGPRVARDAVLRAFSALPPHLRRHLGPGLAERFLARGDAETARALRDAILRAPGEAGAATEILGLAIGQARGQEPDAHRLDALQAAPGTDGVRAMALALRTAMRSGHAPEAGTVTAAEAMLQEFRGTAEAAELAREVAAAQVMLGNAARAFGIAGPDETLAAQVWDVLARHGEASQFLERAIRAPGDLPPGLAAGTRQRVAARLLDAGFPEAALVWLDPAPGRGTEEGLLLARARLAAGDARGVLRLLAGDAGEGAGALREAAALRLALPVPEGADGPEEAFPVAGDPAPRARRNAQWPVVAASGDTDWSAAARLAAGPETAETRPLARGRALVAEAEAARAVLAALLAATAVAPGR